MHELLIQRVEDLQRRMADRQTDLVLLTDPDSIYYLCGYWGYLGTEFGRPTVLAVPGSGPCVLITPKMEAEMARNMTDLEEIRPWADGVDGEWCTPVRELLRRHKARSIGVEWSRLPPLIAGWLQSEFPATSWIDATVIIGAMRMIKTPEEIAIMRQAGQVAVAMVEAAEQTIAEGVPEYEVALAIIAGGTRKAAEFLSDSGVGRLFSPTIHNLQILQSGHDTCMVHRRSTVRRLGHGDPVYLCFCGIANFKQYKLGFDRQYFVGTVSDEHARIYETALEAQAAALTEVRPGVPAEQVHAAAEEVYRAAGFEPSYRTGRGIGCSFLEQPELKAGDETRLAAGMTFAVDGGITIPGSFGARVGDSIVVTDTGFECLTPYPKGVRVL